MIRPFAAGVLLCTALGGAAAARDAAPVRDAGTVRALPWMAAQDEAQTPELPAPEGALPPELEERRASAIRRGLAWLATRQDARDGSLRVDDANEGQRAPVAVTSVAALAWMAGGSTMTRGPHQENVRAAIEYLLGCVQGEADKYPGYIKDHEDTLSRTHGHGLATLALAQAYTVSPRSPLGERIGEALVAAVRRIEISQGAEGGWQYKPIRTLEHEGSVTVALLQGLRAAQDAGVQVDSGVVAAAVDYVRRLQVLEESERGKGRIGGFKYGLNDPHESVELTAAALVTLQAAGVYRGREIEEAYDYVWRQLALRRDEPMEYPSSFPYYERFYLAQALWQHPARGQYTRWAGAIAGELIDAQEGSGRWEDVRYAKGGHRVVGQYGSAYATSFNVLFLALPDGFLPVFQR